MKLKNKLLIFVTSTLLACGTLVGCGKSSDSVKPTVDKYQVVVPTSEDYTISGIESDGYEARTEVNFTVTVTNADKEINTVRYAVGTSYFDCSKLTNNQYSFIMPTSDVSISVSIKDAPKYVLSYTGVAKAGLSANFALDRGTTPVVNYSICGLTTEDEAKIEVDLYTVTFLEAGDVTIAAKVNGSVVASLKVTVEVAEHGDTPRDPLTTEEAIDICNGLQSSDSSNKYPTERTYYVRGVVKKVTENDMSYKNATLDLDGGSKGTFTVYRASFDTGFDRTMIEVGSLVTIRSQLLKYGSTCETHTGAAFVAIDNSEARYLDVDSVRSVQVNKSITLQATLRPLGTTGEVTWSVKENDEFISVDQNGVITGLAIGQSEVTVKFNDITRKITIYVVENEVHGETIDDPIDGATATEICKALQSSNSTSKYPTPITYYVEDVVTELIENNPSFANATVMVKGGFEIYRAAFAQGVDRNKIEVGSLVTVKSQLLNFNGTYETHTGAEYVAADNSVPRLIVVDEVRSVQIGKQLNIEAKLMPASAGGEITIQSDDNTVLDVYKNNGVYEITGMKTGTAILSFTCGDLSSTCKVYVTNNEVHGETIDDPLSSQMAINLAKDLQVSNSTDKYPSEIIYYVKDVVEEVVENDTAYSNATVNLVDGFQIFRGGFADDVDRNQIVEGAIVTVRTKLLNFSGTYETHTGAQYVEVDTSEVTGIKLENKTIRIQTGHSEDLGFSLLPVTITGAELDYVVADNDIVSVENGVVTGKAEGSTTVTATYGEFSKVVTVYVTDSEPVWPAGDHISNPFTVDQAVAKAKEIGSISDKEFYYIKGTVKSVENALDNGVFSATLQGSEQDFKLYQLNASETLGNKVKVGVDLLIKAQIFNYNNNTPENFGKKGELLDVIVPDVESISLNKTTANVAVDKSFLLTVTSSPIGSEMGEVEWLIEDETIVSMNEGRVTGLKEGNTTVTAKVGNLTAQCEITVLPKGTLCEQSVNYNPSKEGYARGSSVSEWEGEGLTITFDKGSNNKNAPAYYDGALRCYGGNTFTITGTDVTIQNVVFTFEAAYETTNTLLSGVGTFVSPNWSGEANSVTFTVSGTSGQVRITGIEITFLG